MITAQVTEMSETYFKVVHEELRSIGASVQNLGQDETTNCTRIHHRQRHDLLTLPHE